MFSLIVRCARFMTFLPGRVRVLSAVARMTGRETVVVPIGDYRFAFDAGDFFQMSMALDAYENESVDLLKRILEPGDTYVDVGAQLGFLAAHAAGRIGSGGRLLLFEPDPRPAQRLHEHLKSTTAASAPETSILAKACSDCSRREPLYLADIIGQSTLVGREPHASTPRESVIVDMVLLDQEIVSQGVEHIRLLKIDCEGHELSVLRGTRKSLESGRIDYIIIEKGIAYLDRLGYEAHHLHACLASKGYCGVHEDGRPITPESLNRLELENLVYARGVDLMRRIFPRYEAAAPEEEFKMKRLAQLAQEAADPNHPSVRARLAIRLARTGQLREAIDQALDVLESHPEMLNLRGHLAFWYELSGDVASARTHLLIILKSRPDDVETLKMLKRLDCEQPPETLSLPRDPDKLTP